MEELRIQYFLGASGITSDARKKATLLYFAGPEVQEIFETLRPTDDGYESVLRERSLSIYQGG